jgi:hypothetical protein
VLLTVTENDLYLYITAQDQVEIYFDGQPQDINKDAISKNWQSVKIVKIPRGTRVLSVKATNLGKNPGLLASITGDRLVVRQQLESLRIDSIQRLDIRVVQRQSVEKRKSEGC